MMGNLQNVADDELLQIMLMILARPGELTAFDKTELGQVNAEFKRRDATCQPETTL